MRSSRLQWEHGALFALLIGSFFVRYFLWGASSLWFDELLSVKIYAEDPQNLLDMVGSLAATSVHPPFYQILLYCWLQIGGASPEAARLLSTLFVLGAVYFTHVLVRRFNGPRVALLAAFSVSISLIGLTYSLEARSYALQILLATASSVLFWNILLGPRPDNPWAPARWKVGLGLFLVNLAFLFTHYLGLFFLAAQAVFLLFAIPSVFGTRKLWSRVLAWGSYYLTQVVLFLGVWGSVLVSTYARRAPGTEDAETAAPGLAQIPSLFLGSVLEPNIPVDRLLAVVLFLFLFAALVFWFLRKKSPAPETRLRSWFFPYLLFWTLVPFLCSLLLSYLTPFSTISSRYAASSSPAVRILLVLGLFFALSLVFRLFRSGSKGFFGFVNQWLVPLGLAAVFLISVPSYPKFVEEKVWTLDKTARAVAADLELLSRDGHAYALWEVGTREVSTLGYYLKDSVSMKNLRRITPADEQRGAVPLDFAALAAADLSPDHGRLVVTFTHRSLNGFPNLLAALEKKLSLVVTMIDSEGHGYLIFEAKEVS